MSIIIGKKQSYIIIVILQPGKPRYAFLGNQRTNIFIFKKSKESILFQMIIQFIIKLFMSLYIQHGQHSIRHILSQCHKFSNSQSHNNRALHESMGLNQVHKKLELNVHYLQKVQTENSFSSHSNNEEQIEDQKREFAKSASRRKNMLQFKIEYSPMHSNNLSKDIQLKLKKQNSLLTSNRSKQSIKKSQYAFPSLLKKLKKNKSPSNASQSQKIDFSQVVHQRKNKKQQEGYQQILTERVKMQEIRKMMVLGKIMSENYRKQIKDMSTRKMKMRYAKEEE